MVLALQIVLIITSVLLILLVLLHRGRGGGLSSLFGGGMQSSLAGSSVAEKNLDRATLFIGTSSPRAGPTPAHRGAPDEAATTGLASAARASEANSSRTRRELGRVVERLAPWSHRPAVRELTAALTAQG